MLKLIFFVRDWKTLILRPARCKHPPHRKQVPLLQRRRLPKIPILRSKPEVNNSLHEYDSTAGPLSYDRLGQPAWRTCRDRHSGPYSRINSSAARREDALFREW